MRQILAVLLLCVAVFGQQQKPVPSFDPQTEFRAAQKALNERAQALAAAQSDYNAAVAQRDVAVYKLMAEAGVKPSECGPPASPFACVKTDPVTGSLSFEKKVQAGKAASPADKPKN